MKFAPVLIMFLLLSCSNVEPQTPSEPEFNPKTLGLMTSDEVINAFQDKNITGPGPQNEKISLDGFKRLKNLVKKTIFFPSKILHSKKQKQMAGFTGKGSVDLRYRDTYVVNQWNGTCTAHGLAAVIENSLGNNQKISERHIWNKYQEYSCEAAINAWENNGCITTDDMWKHENKKPYKGYNDPKHCKTYLNQVTYIEDDLQKMINALDENKPVYVGMSVSRGMLNCGKVVSPTSQLTDGGHALAIVGYVLTGKVLGGGYFIVKNSWGQECGDRGYQYIPFYHCQRKDMYCIMWSVEKTTEAK